jgi:NAD(P)-dependent dehydrogenase (short-subunit alcohol dehydrogenase family)
MARKQWTTADIPDQSGKTALVTGANSGIGYETARALAHKGASVVLACRSMQRGNRAAERVRAEQPFGQVEVMALDLSDLESVRAFAAEFRQKYDVLHILVNNAGVMHPPKAVTKQGFEIQFGVNHLGHFALAGLLLDRLQSAPGARVVTVSSNFHRFALGRLKLDHVRGGKPYDNWRAYGYSKLSNLLFAYELERRLKAAGSGAQSLAAHPGWTGTNLQRTSWMIRVMNPLFGMAPEQGALPTLYAAAAPEVERGAYYGPDGLFGWTGWPERKRSSRASYNKKDAARLWEESEGMVGVRYGL